MLTETRSKVMNLLCHQKGGDAGFGVGAGYGPICMFVKDGNCKVVGEGEKRRTFFNFLVSDVSGAYLQQRPSTTL